MDRRTGVARAVLALVAAWGLAPADRAAHPEDWRSPDALAAAVYSVVSGPPGAERDWDRYRALFADGAELVSIASDPEPTLHRMDVDGYVEAYGPSFVEWGIHETELWSRTERHGHLAQRWGTCEYRWGSEGAAGPARGRCLVGMQFFHDGTRWWIVGMTWEGGLPPEAIPPRYLPADDPGSVRGDGAPR